MSKPTGTLSAGRPSANASPAATLASLADKADTVRVNFDLDRAAHTKLKVYAAKQGKTVKDLLKAYIDSLPEA
jgi:hypothetical protein